MSERLDLDFGHSEIDHGTSDDYYTPPFIFEGLGLRYAMDVCSPPGGSPWIPADRFLSIVEDGLATPWEGRVWSLINTLKFMTPNGEAKGIFMPTVLIGIGEENIEAMRHSGLGRVR